MTDGTTRLLLLRHGHIASHRGDVPLTEEGVRHAERTGEALRTAIAGPVAVMYGGTRRSRETAEALVRGIGDPARVRGPVYGFALRNPDMYLAGTRVNMVSSHAALAEQVPGMSEAEAKASGWWTTFVRHRDRVGWWLRQDEPPGESARDLVVRIHRFAATLADPGPLRGRTVIGVTHSPLLRAVLLHATGADPGEPGYVTGAELTIDPGEGVRITAYDPLGRPPDLPRREGRCGR